MVGGSYVCRTNDTARAAALSKSAHAPPCQLEVGATAHMLNTVAGLANDTLVPCLHGHFSGLETNARPVRASGSSDLTSPVGEWEFYGDLLTIS